MVRHFVEKEANASVKIVGKCCRFSMREANRSTKLRILGRQFKTVTSKCGGIRGIGLASDRGRDSAGQDDPSESQRGEPPEGSSLQLMKIQASTLLLIAAASSLKILKSIRRKIFPAVFHRKLPDNYEMRWIQYECLQQVLWIMDDMTVKNNKQWIQGQTRRQET
jgi:hypothetical protein